MSASRDKSQKITFVYSNLYKIYKQQQPQAEAPLAVPTSIPSVAPTGLTRGQVLKASTTAASDAVRISDFRPIELLNKRIHAVAKPQVLAGISGAPVIPVMKDSRNEALETLKQNMRSLNDLHSRLKVMLTELEDLVKE